MPSQQLDNLVRIGQLRAESATQAEIDGLMRSGAARIKDAENEQLSVESRFDLAYNAAHAFSLAALRFHGYRSENRFLVFQSLQHTLGLSPPKWRVLDQAHKKRNLVEYEGGADIDAGLLEALIRIAREVESGVIALGQLPR
ncbi:MAG: hypothetical protein E6J90_25600 [Deltaproteobacteria bacterium]|nr:MAG: hypothetical protein E6J91_24765 [Deltaproteobacteria bacterium]TMQ15305.1 MAG: hypothetical protein E6J90_25600 [Deltaproteobacteria bacterium]